jgi:hypothetical protein
MTQAQMDGMYAVLSDADADRDAEALADAAWRLYAETAQAQAEAGQARAALAQLATAARAAIAAAADGATDPLAPMRHVLNGHSWLPMPGASVAQLLAAPPGCTGNRSA